MRLNGEESEKVKKLKYLGLTFAMMVGMEVEVEERNRLEGEKARQPVKSSGVPIDPKVLDT